MKTFETSALKARPRAAEPSAVNLRAAVVQQLRDEIVSGKAGPGAVFSAPSLARSLGVSTTPVREALLALAASGLVEPMRNRGFRVLQASASDLKDLAILRVQLEVMAVTTICERRLFRADALIPAADEIAAALTRGHSRQYVAADRRFHRLLIGLADNKYLTEMAMNLRDNMRIYGLESDAGIKQQRASVQEHFALIDALRACDPVLASRLMEAHILAWIPIVSASALALSGDGRAADVGSDTSLRRHTLPAYS